MRACDACGGSLEGRRSDARFCSDRCKDRIKKRLQRGSVVPMPARAHGGDEESPLVRSLLAELEAAGRLDTTDGQHAVLLTRRLVAAERDTGSAVASLSKEARAARLEALKGAQVAQTALDELRARRAAKRGA